MLKTVDKNQPSGRIHPRLSCAIDKRALQETVRALKSMLICFNENDCQISVLLNSNFNMSTANIGKMLASTIRQVSDNNCRYASFASKGSKR